MSDYDSSEGSSHSQNNNRTTEYEAFHYDYYLSNSLDILDQWKLTVASISHLGQADSFAIAYLEKEFPAVCKIQKFRTADIIRSKAFIYMLKRAFEEIAQQLNKLFDSKTYLANKEESIITRVKEGKVLEDRLQTLLLYVSVANSQGLCLFYTSQDEKTFEQIICEILSKLYTYMCSPRLLWGVSDTELALRDTSSNTHAVSLGGNQAYYKNIMRSMLKRNWQLKQVYDKLLPDLRKESIQNFEKSDFLARVISEVLSLQQAERLTDKEKRQFIDIMKGLYFLEIQLRKKSLYYECMLTKFHLDVLISHRMFKGYAELQQLYINVLQNCKINTDLFDLVYGLQLELLTFQKRKRVPQIENQLIDITFNYIAVAKGILEEEKVFSEISPVPFQKAYAITRDILEYSSLNGLLGLLMALQQNSKDAFSLGDISVHKIYLKMSEIIKEIYLSYQHQNWLFPTDILHSIPLRYFIDNSDDIKADIKKTLFVMVEVINEGKMPHKISYVDGSMVREKVRQSEYLQVILFFLQECKIEQQYINLPEIIPASLQTSILFIKSLELKLNEKEPTPDQMPYVVNMLKNCQKYKLTINFRWYQTIESIEDREIQFNIEKGLTEDWMREIYRNTINLRQSKQIRSHFDKYANNKGLSILNLASIFKYCHQIEPGSEIPEKSIKQEDLFTLLEEIKMLMSIHFDIFNLNKDQEISLNYIHVCLGFYNSCYKETPGNQAYILIMEKIMRPYLSQPNSSQNTFKNKYPGFFQKWLYSFQIGSIFNELGCYISEKGEDQSCRQDIISKIQMVSQFIDNKQNILNNIKKLSDLTEFIVLFATLISRQAHPQVYVQSIELFCLFLNTFSQVKKQASLDFMLDANLLSDVNLIQQILSYIQKSSRPYKKDEVSMLNSLIDNLVQYMNKVGFKIVNDILSLYVRKHQIGFQQALDHLLNKLFLVEQKNCTLLVNVFRFIILIKKKHHENKQESLDCLQKLKIIAKSLHSLGNKAQFKQENFKFLELVFIEDIVIQLNKSQEEKSKEYVVLAKEVFHNLIQNYGTNDDLIFFAEKLQFFDLVLGDNKSQLNPREENLLIDLMIQNRNKGNATQLIKKIVRQNRKICDISDKVIDILSKQKDKIHSHHINKFIHVNNRYPKEKIEQFIIENIGCQRNVAAVKIKQQYLIKDLVKKLQKIPKNICEELLFKPIKNEQYEKLIDFVSDIFEKLLYLPIKNFQNVNLKFIEQIHQENQDWNTQSQGEHEYQTKQQKNPKEDKSSKCEYKSGESGNSDQVEEQEPINAPNQSHSSQSNDNNSQQDDYSRPDFLQIFINEEKRKDLELYGQFMIKRQELDVMIDSKYQQLKPNSQLVGEKEEVFDILLNLVIMLNKMDQVMAKEVVAKMPQRLFQALRIYGLEVPLTQQIVVKRQKMEKIVTKSPKFMGQLFSDRSESDDSNIIQDRNDQQYQEEDYEGSQINHQESDYEMDDSENDNDNEIEAQKNGKKPRKPHHSKFAQDQAYDMPSLLPTYSKIEEQISGTQLKKEDLVKILQISLYWLLHLPESQIKSKHITSYYMQILSSNLGQLFFESYMTILRFDQNKENLENYVTKLSQNKSQKVQIGLQEITMQNAIANILYFIKEYQEQNRDNEAYSNILFKESGTLLPISQQMITKLDLPFQNNCITLLMIYIETNRAKIRNSISELDFGLVGTQLAQLATEYRLKYSEMVRIIEKICKYGSNNKIWEMIEENMNLKAKRISKLFSCVKGYGQHLYTKLEDVGFKIMKTIKAAQIQAEHHKEHQKLHNIENTHHIISKLVLSCKQEIKQFYYVNKFNLKKLMEDQNIDIYEEIQSVQTVPNRLLKNKDKIFKNKELIKLVEVMVYFIKMLKDQFYGKIEDKLFSKLIHYPKMIIEAVWYYIFIFAKHKDYSWTTPSEVEAFLKQYPYIGSYNFSNLQQVFNLVVYFLNLQPFCTSKFKQLFLPILMKNPKLAREITLMFKVPRVGDDNQDYATQSIVVTRKCSFDMAFYQLTGQAIQVEFHEEEGSDHGGLVRELMIGWKGRGVGEQAFFIGKILGISFKQGVPYGGTLDIGMFVAITNYNMTLQFFNQADPQIFKSLKYIQDNDPEPLCLKFMVEHIINGKLVQFELVQGGRNIDLVQANKHKYLDSYVKNYYYLGRQRELKQLKHGFNTVVYPEYAQIFTPFEMLRQIRGQEVVDIKMLISKARYQGYSADSNIIKWFWSVVETFDQEKMNTFIQFVTGSPKITVYNSNFSITIEKVYDIECLPVAHTCFNTIDLPEYSTKEILEKKLLTAILEGNYSFGIL